MGQFWCRAESALPSILCMPQDANCVFSDGDSQISRYHPEGVESCFLLLRAVEGFLKRAGCSEQVRRAMENEMLFHICGFAGHIYYRTDSSRKECLESVRELAGRKEFRQLLRKMKPAGVKNRTAAFLLGHRMCRAYHWMCLGLYGRQRMDFRKQIGRTGRI